MKMYGIAVFILGVKGKLSNLGLSKQKKNFILIFLKVEKKSRNLFLAQKSEFKQICEFIFNFM